MHIRTPFVVLFIALVVGISLAFSSVQNSAQAPSSDIPDQFGNTLAERLEGSSPNRLAMWP